MNLSFNYTLNTLQNNSIDIGQQCPDITIVYKQWGNAFIILFALMMFSLIVLYIVMDIRLNKEIEKNKRLLEVRKEW